MAFFLVRLEPDPDGGDKMLDVPIPDYGPYEKGPEAAKAAKDLTATLGYKVQPRRIHQAPDWRTRQQDRLDRGLLAALPEAWKQLAPVTDHFAHLSFDSARVAFTENDELGTIDRVTLLNPGRYITRFYPEVNDDLRRKLIASIDPSGEILYAWSPEEMERIYKEGPSSCMDGSKVKTFASLPCWPSAPYAGGDLAVAYTMNVRGRVASRCICWPEKKLFGRVFGDHQRMIPAMEAEGYTYLRERNDVEGNSGSKCFDGAILRKIPMEHVPGNYVMPYFDDLKFAVDAGDHFISALDQPEGKPGALYCVSGSTAGQTQAFRWCPKTTDFQPAGTFAMVQSVDEEWSIQARNYHTFVSAADNLPWPVEERVWVQIFGSEKAWSKQQFAENGEKCSHSGKNYPSKEIVTLSDGTRVWSHYKATIDGQDVLNDNGNPFDGSRSWSGNRGFNKSSFMIKDYVENTWRDIVDAPSGFQTYDREMRIYGVDGEVRLHREPTVGDLAERYRREEAVMRMTERMNDSIELAIVNDPQTRRYRVA